MENEDGTTTYTFHLRDGIKWSDGKAVTAQDFVYTWQRLVTPETAADYNYMIDCVVNANAIMAGEKDPSELAVKAVDDKTFEVTVNDVPYFTEICAFPATFPVRQDIIEQYGDQWTFDTATYIGNGPYKMTAWNHNSEIVMEPSETYYEEVKGPSKITFKLMDDNNAMLAGFNSGELDFIEDMPVDEIPTLLADGKLNIVDYIGTYYVCFQTQKGSLRQPPSSARLFTLAVDRKFIVEKVTQSGQVEAGGFVPAGIYDAAGSTGDDLPHHRAATTIIPMRSPTSQLRGGPQAAGRGRLSQRRGLSPLLSTSTTPPTPTRPWARLSRICGRPSWA